MTREEFERIINTYMAHVPKHRDGTKSHDAEQRAEIARLREWQRIVLGTGTNQEAVIRMAAAEYTQVAVQTWKQAYHALMGKAVRFGIACMEHFALHDEAKQFLASPEVQACIKEGQL